jgi:hypothetical protein
MKRILYFLIIITSFSFSQDNRNRFFPKSVELVKKIPNKENVWVFILAGQSNMAGRGLVEPQDTLANERIITINANRQLVFAKEPIHFQDSTMKGLDCGLSFGKTIIKLIPDSIRILILPTAIGGSSVSQWLGDSIHRNVKLLSNFRDNVEIGKKYGQIKGILWHQGENDANAKNIPQYREKLTLLFNKFRLFVGNNSLPIILGELGTFSNSYEGRIKINRIIKEYPSNDKNTAVVSTIDLKDRGDNVHFNSEGQRIMGQRFAEAYIRKFK